MENADRQQSDDGQLMCTSNSRASMVPFLLPTGFLPVTTAATHRRHDHYSTDDKRWIFLALVALPLWILFGNLLVLFSVVGFRHLRTLSNWVIASLAFTDFLLALTVVPFGIYQLVSFTSVCKSLCVRSSLADLL